MEIAENRKVTRTEKKLRKIEDLFNLMCLFVYSLWE